MKTNVNFLLSLFAIILFANTLTAQDYYYYYSAGRKIFMDKAPHWVVIQIDNVDVNREVLEERLNQDGELKIRKTLDSERGFYWLETVDRSDYKDAIEDLKSIKGFIRLIPAFMYVGEDGDTTRFVMQDIFRVKFHDHISIEEINKKNEKYGVEIVNVNDRGRYLMRVTEETSLNILEIANIYYENDITL